MAKQDTIERIRAGEDTIAHRMGDGGVPSLFGEHYRLSLRSMTPEAAAHTAYTAVVNHLASLQGMEAGDPMQP